MMFYASMGLTIAAGLLYHFASKSIPKTVNPILSIIVTYLMAIALSLIILPFYPAKTPIVESGKQLNWASFAVGIAIVGIEIGFLLAYRAGWNISLGAVTSNVAIMIILVPAGALIFKEHLSVVNMIGLLFCILGLILVTLK